MPDRRVVVVTGSSTGLGAALVAHFASRGDNVVLNYRSQQKMRAVMAPLESQGHAELVMPYKADVTHRAQVQEMFASCGQRFGASDVLIHCAGVNRDAPFIEMTDEHWDEVVDAHLKSAFICCQEFVRQIPQGRGQILTLGAACGLQGRINGANFCSAKGGIAALTKCLARELAPRIQVNCLVPSAVDTEEVRERYHLDSPDGLAKVLSGIPMKRVGALEDVSRMVESILGARFTTGATFFVNGGEFMH